LKLKKISHPPSKGATSSTLCQGTRRGCGGSTITYLLEEDESGENDINGQNLQFAASKQFRGLMGAYNDPAQYFVMVSKWMNWPIFGLYVEDDDGSAYAKLLGKPG
jgi:hypothetical protein